MRWNGMCGIIGLSRKTYGVIMQNMRSYHAKPAEFSCETCGVFRQNLWSFQAKPVGLSRQTCGVSCKTCKVLVPEVVFCLEKSANGRLEIGKDGRWKSISNVRISVSNCLIVIYEKTFSCFLCSCRSGRNTAFSLHLKIQNDSSGVTFAPTNETRLFYLQESEE